MSTWPDDVAWHAKLRSALIKMRRESGLTQLDLSVESGVSQWSISHLERGVNRCSLDVLIRLAGVFGVAPSDILKEAGL